MADVPCRVRARRALVLLSICGVLTATAACTGSDRAAQDGGSATGAGSPPPGGDSLLSTLRGGGAIIVLRHAATDRSQLDADDRSGPSAGTVDLDDCSTQRNLTEKGRADARAIGTAVRELRIPVGTVMTSPYCRARQTAKLAFGRSEVVHGLERLYPVPDENSMRLVNRLVRERAPRPGAPNLVIAAHGVYPSALRPAVTLSEGEAAVYAVRGDNFDLLGRIVPDQWADLE